MGKEGLWGSWMRRKLLVFSFFFFQAEDGIRDTSVTGVQTCALPIWIRLAEANVRGAQATYERTKQQIVFAAEQTYLQALLAAESVAAAQRSLAVANESLRVAQVRFSAGAGARLDVLQAEVAVASAEQALVQAQTGVGNAQANLNALINLPLDTPLALTDTLTPRPVDIALADAIARALRERADLAALRNR